ncbi:MAG: hypothetical protein CL910_05925 [Deltaproteobacteria bacterium]|jgi:Flp pilus assembly protein TadD|nr:hypothetical protein [Deltaproteobacteria bacterium]
MVVSRTWALLAVLVLATGCASFEASRLAASGSQAIGRGQYARAVEDLERAATLAPRAAPVQNDLGVAYLAAGRPGDALRAFERAVALDCSHEPSQQNLRALRQGRPGGALAAQP